MPLPSPPPSAPFSQADVPDCACVLCVATRGANASIGRPRSLTGAPNAEFLVGASDEAAEARDVEAALSAAGRKEPSLVANEEDEYAFHCWVLDRAFGVHFFASVVVLAFMAHVAGVDYASSGVDSIAAATLAGLPVLVVVSALAVWLGLSHLPGRSPARVRAASRMAFFAAVAAPHAHAPETAQAGD